MKKRIKYLVFSILFIAITANTFAQDKKYESLKMELQSYIDSITQNDSSIKSIALLVEMPGVKWKGASGYSVPEENIKMLPDDQFITGSVAKMMMSTIIYMLAEEGKLNITDKIISYLPDSIINDLHTIEGKDYGEQITINHLLHHTSGLDNFWNQKDMEMVMQETDKFWTPQAKIEYCKQVHKPKFEPGKSFAYSDIGYDVLGLIIEKVTGKQLFQVYNELLINPLKMDHTYRPFYEKQRPTSRKPSNAYLGDICYSKWTAFTLDWGGGGIMTNTEDLNTFIRAFENNKIFKNKETKEKFFDLVKVQEGIYYGSGIFFIKLNEIENGIKDWTDFYGHTGANGAFMFYSKDREISITGTINQLDESKTATVLFTVLKMVKKALENKT